MTATTPGLGRFSFAMALILIQTGIFAFIYFSHSLFARGFGIEDSLKVTSYSVSWLFLSLLVPMQAMALLLGYGLRIPKIGLIFLATAIAYTVACKISFSSFGAAWQLLALPSRESVGEGFVLTLSVVIAYATVHFAFDG